MLAKLEDGSIVTLEKDCSCTDHDGPHWLHSDRLFRQLNLQLLGSNNLQTQAFAMEEQARLTRKLSIMKAKRIAELLQ
ncbi:MAG: hypothetical protein Q8K07_15825 [Methylicorpusculum sp.]|uniref:hypothetical protein n=1 Tax=Methylicorpusculum TaxID=2713642 RepID=UPI00135CF59F|nr:MULTISPECIES: hypothetical protein [Methylicorpusculum]MCD2452043.1 hypothetical protein [Methylicorpusculum oleiharenae]MDP2203492.1 hypothetical protein [Methylicorpusculum sp.]